MGPRDGLEPPTSCILSKCSFTELPGHNCSLRQGQMKVNRVELSHEVYTSLSPCLAPLEVGRTPDGRAARRRMANLACQSTSCFLAGSPLPRRAAPGGFHRRYRKLWQVDYQGAHRSGPE